MPLAKRIIPCLDVDAGRVVKGINFLDLVDAGDPAEQARFYNDEGADELVLLDITATQQQRGIMHDIVRKTADEVFIPLTVGGGLRTLEDMRSMLHAGADKISINSAAIRDAALITRGAHAFGSQFIVVAIDAKRQHGRHWEVFAQGGRSATGLDAVAWAREAQERGAGEILLTSMDRDGTKAGYDIDLLCALHAELSIPIIASGGAGNLEHLRDALLIGHADAVLAASIFHFRTYTIGEAKHFLHKAGITVRMDPRQ